MKMQWLGLVCVMMVAGCYRQHGAPLGEDSDAGVIVDGPIVVSVMTQTGAMPALPAADVRVVVEDCDSGALVEAVTGADGVAEFDETESTCWNVTAVLGGMARSVLRAPVPLPGPIVFPVTAPPAEGETIGWEVRLEGIPNGEDPNILPYDFDVSAPGAERDYSLNYDVVGGSAHRATLQRDSLAVVVASSEDEVVGAALVPLSPTDSGALTATLAFPTAPAPLHTARVEVLIRAGGVYNMVNPGYGLDSFVYASSPSGGEYQIGPRVRFNNNTMSSPAGLEVTRDYRWLDLPGTESWTPPMSGSARATFRREDPCSTRTVSWGRIRLEDGVTHRTEIPVVTTRSVSGTSLDTLSVHYGGEGHRSFLALRVAGEQPFEWMIEPFATGVTLFEGLPPLPSGVADSIGLTERSLYVRFGVTAPSAATFAPTTSGEQTVPWLIHEGFVIGQVSDFGESVADCDQVT